MIAPPPVAPRYRVRMGAAELVRRNLKGTVPEGGWTAETFREHGLRLIKGMVRLQRVVTKTAEAALRKTLQKHSRALVEEVVRRGEAAVMRRRGRRSADAKGVEEVLLNLPGDEDVWASAVDSALKARGIEFRLDVIPPIQSVGTQGVSKTGQVLGLDVSHEIDTFARGEVTRIGERIRKIDETTRDKFRTIITGTATAGKPVTETAKELRRQLTQFEDRRNNTIARTETQMAWTRGSVAAMQQSESVTHVSVIGCESRELERWGHPSFQQFMFRGEGTCNIQNVPVNDAHLLNFHPNHTGTVVPSAFRTAAGGHPDIGTGTPVGGIPTWKPVLSKPDAAKFTAGSALEGKTFYHYTTGAAVEKIEAEGFKPSHSWLLRGINLTADATGQQTVAPGAMLTRSRFEKRVAVMVRAEKPLTVDGFTGMTDWIKANAPGTDDTVGALKKHGYDAVVVRWKNRPDWVVAFEREQAVMLENSAIDVARIPKPPVIPPVIPKPPPAPIPPAPIPPPKPVTLPPPKPPAAPTPPAPPTPVEEAGFSKPSRRIRIESEHEWKRPALASVKQAIKDLDKVVRVPDSISVTTVARDIANPRTYGQYMRDGRALGTITMRKGLRAAQNPETFFHEFGHALDHQAFAKGAYNGFSYGTEMHPRPPFLKGLMEAFRSTKAAGKIDKYAEAGKKAKEWADYARKPIEVWARAFSQFIAEKSGNAAALESVKGSLWGGAQWETEDFAPMREFVANALRGAKLLIE